MVETVDVRLRRIAREKASTASAAQRLRGIEQAQQPPAKAVATPTPTPAKPTPTPSPAALPTPTPVSPEEQLKRVEQEQQPLVKFEPVPFQPTPDFWEGLPVFLDELEQEPNIGIPKRSEVEQGHEEGLVNIYAVSGLLEDVHRQLERHNPGAYEEMQSGESIGRVLFVGPELRNKPMGTRDALLDAIRNLKLRRDDWLTYLGTDEGLQELFEKSLLGSTVPWDIPIIYDPTKGSRDLANLARNRIPGRGGELVGQFIETALDPMLLALVGIMPPVSIAAKVGLITTISAGVPLGGMAFEEVGLPRGLGELAGAVALPLTAFGGVGLVRGTLAYKRTLELAGRKMVQHQAFQGGVQEMFLGTTDAGAQALRKDVFMRATPPARGRFRGVTVFREEGAALGEGRAASATTGSEPLALKVEVPKDLRIATSADELAVRQRLGITGSSSDEMDVIQKALVDEGFGGIGLEEGRVAIFDETMVRTSAPGLTPAFGGPGTRGGKGPPVLPGEVGIDPQTGGPARMMPELPTMAEAQADISGTPMARKVYRAVYQVTGKVPGLRRLHIPINPAALLSEPFRAETVAYNTLLDVADATNRHGVSHLYRLGQPYKVRGDGVVTNVTLRPGAPRQAKTQHIYDVLERGESWYVLSPAQQRWRNVYTRLIDEAVADYMAVGGTLRQLGFAEGEHYIPRSVISKDGIEKLVRAMQSSGRRGFKQPRFHEYAADFVAEGGVYQNDPIAVLQTTLNAIRHSTADEQLIAAIAGKGVKVSSLIPAKFRTAIEKAAAKESALKRLESFLTSPAMWRPGLRGAGVRQIRDEARKIATQLRDGKITLQEYESQLKPLRDQAAQERKLWHDRLGKAKQDMADKEERIRGTFIAKEGGAVPPQVFDFPEDSFGVGQLSSTRWPQLRDIILPDDIIVEVERQMGDIGNSFFKWAQKIGDVQRVLGAGADLNFPFLQGMPLLARRPAQWAMATGKAYQTALMPRAGVEYMTRQAAKYPEEFAAFLRNVHQMGEQEFFQAVRGGGLIRRVPGAKQTFGRVVTSFDTFLNVGRWEWFKGIYPTARNAGGDSLAQLGAVVRNGTGTVSTRALGVGLTQRQLEGGFILFAPRYTRSAFALMFDAIQGGIRGQEARRALINMLSGGTILYSGIALALGQEPILDPTKSGFMSIRIGDNWVGAPGIFRSMIRTMGFSIMAAKDDPSVFYDPRRILENPVFRFWLSRAAPSTGTPVSIGTGENYIGKPTRASWGDFGEFTAEELTPFFVGTYLESRGGMTQRLQATTGEYFLGRSTPVSAYQLRNEGVFRWFTKKADAWAVDNKVSILTRGNPFISHDPDGPPFVPSEYGHLTGSQRDAFDGAEPQWTREVINWRDKNRRAWSELDRIGAETVSNLGVAGRTFEESGDGRGYRRERAAILGNDRQAKEAFFDRNPADWEPKTQEQKWVRDHQKEVIEASIPEDSPTGEPDWELQEQLGRVWCRENGEEACEVIDREYRASMDRTDRQFRLDNTILQDGLFAWMDGLWSEAGIAAAGFLPPTNKGGTEIFRSSREYEVQLRSDFFNMFKEDGIPDSLLSIKTGSYKDAKTFEERWGSGPLSAAKAKDAAGDVTDWVMKDYDALATEALHFYLATNPGEIELVLRWDYYGISQEIEEFIP